ncbi:MAG: hypothetical protein IT462_04510 [Planctomycetes bacterium]|nr:hypothetical protein [Planctomycetota bacterium]
MSIPETPEPRERKPLRWEWTSEPLTWWGWSVVAVGTVLISLLLFLIYIQAGPALGWPIPQWMLMNFYTCCVVGLAFIVPAAIISSLIAKYLQYRLQDTSE